MIARGRTVIQLSVAILLALILLCGRPPSMQAVALARAEPSPVVFGDRAMVMVRESVLDTLELLSDNAGADDLLRLFGENAARVLIDLWHEHRIIPATFGGNLSKALLETEPLGHCQIVMPVAAAVFRSPLGVYIKLNLEGAFFKRTIPVWHAANPAIPFARTPIMTMYLADRYSGGSRQARVIILLHELGHVIGVLPEDSSDPQGRIISERNNQNIIERCHAQLASLTKREISIASVRRLDGF